MIDFFSSSHWTTQFMLFLIGSWVVFSTVYIAIGLKNFRNVNSYLFDAIPGVFTTLGVLGTFVGVAVALVGFDENDIEGSIPILLAGIKTAFFTSIMGISLSLISAKFIYWAQSKADKDGEFDTAEVQKLSELVHVLNKSIEENRNQFGELKKAISSDSDESLSTHFTKLRNLIRDSDQEQQKVLQKLHEGIGGDGETSLLTNTIKLREQQRENNQAQLGLLSEVKESLGGDGETSLLVQFQKMREEQLEVGKATRVAVTEINETQKQTSGIIEQKFEEFTKLLQESNTEALVQAIENVIGGFNDKLNDLLERLVKENFEQLNNSVQQLNTWQQENKEHIQKLTDQFKDVSERLQTSSKSIESISDSTDKLTNNDGRLVKLIKELEEVMVENTMFKESVEGLTKSSSQVLESSEALKEWTEKGQNISKALEGLTDKLKEIEALRNQSGDFWEDVKSNLKESGNILKEGNEDLLNQIKSHEQSFNDRMDKSFLSLDRVLQAMVSEYAKRAESFN